MQQIGKVIGRRKYEALKSFDLENITEENLKKFNLQFKNLTVAEGLKMIKNFETKYTFENKNSILKVAEYYEEIEEKRNRKKEVVFITKQWLWKKFSENYFLQNGVRYSNSEISIQNIKPLIYYFIGDFENFKKCENLTLYSEPSLKKGILLVGGNGNGKTSSMEALEASLKGINVSFKTYTTNAVVDMYEACSNSFDKDEFNRIMKNGRLNFDDVLGERVSSNFGKVDVMKEIFEQRYYKGKKTHISINFKYEAPGDINEALIQLGERYGAKVYDRIFSMYNIIEFKGSSLRK